MAVLLKWSRLVGLVLGCAVLLLACQGGTDQAGPPLPQVQVTLSPDSVTVRAGETASLEAFVTGTTQMALTWSVDSIPGGNAAIGTLLGTGNLVSYAAPPEAGVHVVTATSVADPTRNAASVVTVQAPIQVSLSPGAASIRVEGSVSFTCSVTGTDDTAVSWTVDGLIGGSLSVGTLSGTDSAATYTAPSAAGTHTVTATSHADPTKSASCSVGVLPPVQVTLSPASALIDTGSTLSLTATVSGSADVAVQWTVDEISMGNALVGTLTGSGSTVTYTAPATIGTHFVTARSAADATKFASCLVTVQTPILVKVALAPAGPVDLNVAGSIWFRATVSGSQETTVVWSVDDLPHGNATVGSVVDYGTHVIYTAPGAPGHHTLKATSLADPRSSGVVALAIHPSCAPPPTSPLVANVRNAPYHAQGDGVTDDTAALQQAVNAIRGTGGTVSIPAGVYLVDPTANDHAALRLGSDMTLDMAEGAVLKALPTATSNHVVLLVSGAQNVTLRGGTLVGNRDAHTITDVFEDGMGVKVAHSSQVVVEGMTARDFWADGFYVAANSRNITLCNVSADNNRRTGMSVVSASGVVVRGSTFINTTGFLEKGVWVCGNGANLEPNQGETVDQVQLLGCTFTTNAANGVGVGPPVASLGMAAVTQVVLDGNSCSGNGLRAGGAGIEISNTSGHQITRNVVTDTIGVGIYLRNEANQCWVADNTVIGTRAASPPGSIGYGILLYLTGGNTVIGNTVSTSAACGLRDAYPTGANAIGPNTLTDNHPDWCP